MTSSYAMHASINIYILNYFIHGAGMHEFLNHATHKLSTVSEP